MNSAPQILQQPARSQRNFPAPAAPSATAVPSFKLIALFNEVSQNMEDLDTSKEDITPVKKRGHPKGGKNDPNKKANKGEKNVPIVHEGCEFDCFSENDPGLFIHYGTDADIHAAMNIGPLPGPIGGIAALLAGVNAAASSTNFKNWSVVDHLQRSSC